MSSTGRPKKDGTVKERHKDDLYVTPKWVIDAALDQPEVQEILGKIQYFVEPCAGDLAIVDAVRRRDWFFKPYKPLVFVNDIRHMFYHYQAYAKAWSIPLIASIGFDAREKWVGRTDKSTTLAMTNPPFLFAQEILANCLKEADYVIFLVRLDFFGGKKRKELFQKRKPDVLILSQRPSFTTDGKTDSCYYCWMIFHPKESGKWKVI